MSAQLSSIQRVGSLGALLAIFVLTFLSVAVGFQGCATLGSHNQQAHEDPKPRDIQASFLSVPLSFEANYGQTDPQVKFLSRGSGYGLYLTPSETVLALRKAEPTDTKSTPSELAVLRMRLVGANPAPELSGSTVLPGKVHYFIGNDPTQWRTDVPTYAQVRYANVYPGIDLIYYGNQQQLEFDFVVAPGQDPVSIMMAFEGAERLTLDASGDLVLQTSSGAIRQRKPVIYQEVAGKRQDIVGRYLLKTHNQVGFQVAAYDATKPLIIDPILVFSTYLGGSGADHGNGIAVDSASNVYVTGNTRSADFPLASPFQGIIGGGFGGNSNDAFVTKLNAMGNALVYSTFLGGSDIDEGFGIAVDAAGNAYVTGKTTSEDFPTTAGAFDTDCGNTGQCDPVSGSGGRSDVFVTKLNATGSALIYSTFLGGGDNDVGSDIAVDVDGNAYITGITPVSAPAVFVSGDFPTTPGAFQTMFSGGGCLAPGTLFATSDAFIAKLNATGSDLLYSSYLGGGLEERGTGIAVDGDGNAYVSGFTNSTNFPTTATAFQPDFGNTVIPISHCQFSGDAFVVKVNPTGSALVYSTYLGGSGDDSGSDMALDASGNVYVTGRTHSEDFPTTGDALQPTLSSGTFDAFITKLNPTGSTLLYSTFLGGDNVDRGNGIAVDTAGNAIVTGSTSSTDFPTTVEAFQPDLHGGFEVFGNPSPDAFVSKLDAPGSGLIYSTYLGGSGSGPFLDGDQGFDIAIDAAGNAYVTGRTNSTDFPTTVGALQTDSGGGIDKFGQGGDTFVAKITFSTSSTLAASVLPSSRSVQVGTTATAFGLLINGGTTTATSCSLAPSTNIPATFDYRTTDPVTNEVTGTLNTPVDIPVGAAQTFVFGLTPTDPFPSTDVALNFSCTNTDPAPSSVGLNTLLLSASATPVPDIVALVATPTNDGIIHLPGSTGGIGSTGVFVVASLNVGATGTITVSADTGNVSLPLNITLCQTNPPTGACLAPPNSSVTTNIVANTTPSFGVFVEGLGPVPFDPATNRLFIRFKEGGITRGSTSVAVQTNP